MGKKCLVLVSLTLTVLMIAGLFGACKKNGDDGTSNDVSDTKLTTASKTTLKTTSRTTSEAVTNAGSNTNNTNETASTGVAYSDTGNINADQENKNVISEENNVQTGGNDGTDWAEDINIGTIGEIVENDIDLGGITIYAGTWEPLYIPYDKPESSPEYVIWARRIKAAEEKYNFKLEWYVNKNATNYQNDMITQAMSGVVFADVFRTASSYRFPMFVKNNVIVPLDDYIDYESPIIKNNKYMYYGSYWKGKHYGITYQFKYACEFMWYNSDILSREGQPDILDLVEAKQWNWETFLGIAKSCTKDIDGNGIVDQYGVVAHSNWYLAKYLLYSNGLFCGATVDDDYNVNLIIRDPAAIRTFQFVSDLAFVHKVYQQSSASNGIYTKGLAAMQIHNWGGPNTALINSGMKSYLCPMPMGPDVDYYTNINASQFYSVSSACKYPKEVAQIFLETCLLWNEDGQSYISEVQELEAKYFSSDWLWNPANSARLFSTEREYKTTYLDRYDLFKPDYSDGFPNLTSRIQTLIVNPLLAGNVSVAQALDSSENELQAIIDEFK